MLRYPVTPVLFIALLAWIAYNQITENRSKSMVGGIGALVYLVFSRGKPPLDVEGKRVDVPRGT